MLAAATAAAVALLSLCRSFRLRLAARPEALGDLRAEIRRWLAQDGADRQTTFELVLACAEVFANAVEHPVDPATAHVVVECDVDGDDVLIRVRDSGRWREPAEEPVDRGWGLKLARALADSVDIETTPGGTTVTLRRRLPRP